MVYWFGILALPILWLLFDRLRRKIRGWWLTDEYIGYNGEFLSQHNVCYCEPGFELSLSGDEARKGKRGRMVVTVPKAPNYQGAPEWAKTRREQIVQRLETQFDCEDHPSVCFSPEVLRPLNSNY